MKNKRRYVLLLLLVCCIGCWAQRRLVVIDVETLIPVDGANAVGSGFALQTDTLGFITVPDSCRSIIFSHVNYESRIINLDEVRDTVFLISKLLKWWSLALDYTSEIKNLFATPKYSTMEELTQIRKNTTKKKAYRKG